MPSTKKRPSVLMVGAYERDNFGDVLFGLQTAAYLGASGYDVTWGAPFAADMSPTIPVPVVQYAKALREGRFDHVWVVGGEVGATTVEQAYLMSANVRDINRYRAMSPGAKRATLKVASMMPDPDGAAYIPRLFDYVENMSAGLTLHSVGLSGIGYQSPGRMRSLIAPVQDADRVVVRDTASSRLLDRYGITHQVAPDLMHTAPIFHPVPRPERPRTVLVQASEKWLDTHGADRFADAIAQSPTLRGRPVRLFTAGTAAGHDSVEAYLRVMRRAREQGADVAFLDASRDAWELVDHIANAALWVGSSLHGRIVAAAYGVPRVSLAGIKLDQYATAWDADMPYGVTPAGVDAAVTAALSDEVASRAGGATLRLTAMADEAMGVSLQALKVNVPDWRMCVRVANLSNHVREAERAARHPVRTAAAEAAFNARQRASTVAKTVKRWSPR